MSKHTNGDWRVSKDEKYVEAKVGEGPLVTIACAMEGYGEEHIANASLMSAAPDLLYAAEKAADWIDDQVWEPIGDHHRLLTTHVVRLYLRNAIAKAKEGES